MTENKSDFNYAASPMLVTPAQAASWLESRADFQRNILKKQVSELVYMINNGQWTLNHQPIAITASGEVLDGQHRLTALVQSGKTLPMMVVLNADPRSFPTIDRGRTRTTISVLRLGGSSLNSSKLAALNSLFWQASSKRSILRTWNVHETQRVADHYSDALDVCFRNSEILGAGCIRGAGLKALTFDPRNFRKVSRFFDVLVTGCSDGPSEYIITKTRSRLMASGSSKKGRWEAHWICCHGLKTFLAGGDIKHAGNIGNQSFMETAHNCFPTPISTSKNYEGWDQLHQRIPSIKKQ